MGEGSLALVKEVNLVLLEQDSLALLETIFSIICFNEQKKT